MLKNKKGFSLIELTAIMLIIGVLATIAIPAYRVSMIKTRLVNNMPLLRAMQTSMLDYYDVNHSLPTKISQLAIQQGEFTIDSDTQATHPATRCVFTLKTATPSIDMDCNQGWTMSFRLDPSALGYSYGEKRLSINGSHSNADRIRQAANSFGWQSHGGSGQYTIP